MIKGPAGALDNFVSLREEDHTYWDRNGLQYESVSAFRARFKEGFDPKIAYRVAGKGEYIGKTGNEVALAWEEYKNERSDIGTRWHNALELFLKTAKVLPENEHMRPGIESICKEYSGYYRIYSEQVVYDEETRTAGTVDNILVFSSHKNSVIDLTDFKTNEKDLNAKDCDKHGKDKNEFFLEPISHLVSSKYNDYALQLSIYAYMIEKKTGRRIGSLRIHRIPTDNPLGHYFIPVPYLKREVEDMFQWKKEHPDVVILQNTEAL